jgi:hypothetical protein
MWGTRVRSLVDRAIGDGLAPDVWLDQSHAIDDDIAVGVLSSRQAASQVSRDAQRAPESDRDDPASGSDQGSLVGPAITWLMAGLNRLARSLRSTGARHRKSAAAADEGTDEAKE